MPTVQKKSTPQNNRHWADELVAGIKGKTKQHRVDDMKTLSGLPHVGSLRAVTTHDIVYKAMKGAGFKVDFTYTFNDMDPLDSLPTYIDKKKYKQHLGKPLFQVPSPQEGFDSFGQYYALKYQAAFNQIDCHPQIFWSHQLYQYGEFDHVVKTALDNAEKIRNIYSEVAGYSKPPNWHPYQVICQKCGKVGTTIVTAWNGSKVTYTCQPDLVKWATGCGHKGKIEPKGINGKLMWKVDWPAHWKVLGVTVEGAGKEHLTEGGSYDIGTRIAKEVFRTEPPFSFLHEFFLIGGKKMSTSKGSGLSVEKITQIIPPELIRFLIAKTPLRKAVNFDSSGNTIPDLFDQYDQAAQAFWDKSDPLLARMFILSQKTGHFISRHFQPRFRDVAKFASDPKTNLFAKFEEIKGSRLTVSELEILQERSAYAQIWLKEYAPSDKTVAIVDDPQPHIDQLSDQQKKFLAAVVPLLSKDWSKPEDLQQAIYDLSKKLSLPAKDAFSAIYLSLLGRSHGPQAAWLLLQNKDLAKERFHEVSQLKQAVPEDKTPHPTKTQSKYLKLDPTFINKYPSASVAFAVIKGVSITKLNDKLEADKKTYLDSVSSISTEDINQIPQIVSYRKMYKGMGLNWHSRRPSPEALLRRIATGKGLYSPINTCVDAYNLVVMKNHVSVGAFDLDQLKFPCALKIASGGESAQFLGDKPGEQTTLKAGEVCYFDQIGPYNMDYNYRDIVRTSVTTDTKNLWINAEGIYNITPKEVEKTLNDTIAIIQKYCGGEVKTKGLLGSS